MHAAKFLCIASHFDYNPQHMEFSTWGFMWVLKTSDLGALHIPYFRISDSQLVH
jgi:hypothetical protein